MQDYSVSDNKAVLISNSLPAGPSKNIENHLKSGEIVNEEVVEFEPADDQSAK
ncbi:19544_t:CDS:2 [Racocetra fulgida]|uniref:19544_t:CDS:1 n=1 Tax=Racocetra fulgida TaxID=60492 RepID=A0A9N8Z806_9GLOM|nr:19544_t:CDS:2 [Racocetra fulgida]